MIECPSCKKVWLDSKSVPLLCYGCGGELKNCQTCGRGKNGWVRLSEFGTKGYKCGYCGGDPYIEGTGRPDWKEYNRAKMVEHFGPRISGDVELLEKYRRLEMADHARRMKQIDETQPRHPLFQRLVINNLCGKWLSYKMCRASGHGRIQAAWKVLGSFFGRRVYISKDKWAWPPRRKA